jgi:caffeoyl-CoA O-methyltransferase
MNKTFGQSDPALEAYVYRAFAPEDELLRDVRERTAAAGMPDIQVAPLDALHLEVLVRAAGAKKAVEVGTLAGYSGVAILRGLGDGGVLHTFELVPRHAEVARETFRRAGFAAAAHVHVGPALENMRAIEGEGPFDVVFIDADKSGYPAYVEWAAVNLRVGGTVLCDNAFLFGRVIGDVSDPEVRAMRRAHEILSRSGHFRATMLPTGEGLALGVKIS